MNKLLVFLVFILSLNLNSQELYPIGLGGSIYGCVNANGNQPPKGRQTGISLNYIPTLAFSGYLPYSQNNNIGLYFDLGLTNLSYADKSVDYGTQYQTDLSYLSAAVYLHLNNFLLGANFGLPVSAKHQAEDIGLPYKTNPVETISNLAELRVGYQVPVYQDENGRLLVTVLAGYQFNGIYKNFKNYDPNSEIIPHPNLFPTEEKHNPRIASIYIGVSYLIKVIY